jgi:hypothetical protein
VRPLLALLLLASCAATPRPATVPVLARCQGQTQHGIGLVTGPATVETPAHVIRCGDGSQATPIEAGGLRVQVADDDATIATLTTWGQPWNPPRWRRLGHGDSGTPVYTAAGELVCVVSIALTGGGYLCDAPRAGEAPAQVTVEAPGWSIDLDAPPGEWP